MFVAARRPGSAHVHETRPTERDGRNAAQPRAVLWVCPT